MMQSYSFLPLHGGRAPKWLYSRMVKLISLISNEIIDEFGADELIKRLTDPYWFQALSCAVGYDWHSSGTTTVTMAALKEALNENSDVYIAGGKGKAGLKTPNDIIKGSDYLSISNSDKFIKYSRLTAKIDSSLIYDNFGIYHHNFIFSKNKWGVVQQGMFSNNSNTAIRFQISSDKIDLKNLSNEPNTSINGNKSQTTLDLTFNKNSKIKSSSLNMIKESFNDIINFDKAYYLPSRHNILENIDINKSAANLLKYANEIQPKDYDELLLVKGIGRKTLRSIALISSLIYKDEIYERDPVLYSYNLGGKDGIPYKINLNDYDTVITSMKDIINNIKLNKYDQDNILKHLNNDLESHYIDDQKNKKVVI